MKLNFYGLIIFLLLPLFLWAGTTGKIAGQIINAGSGDPLIGVNVLVEGVNAGASTDMDGYFFILNIPPGEYRVKAQYLGFREVVQTNVAVRVDHTTPLNFELREQTLSLGESIIVEAEKPEIQRDVTSTVVSVSTADIENLPVNSFTEVLRIQPGVSNFGGLHVRGGRSGELAYLIDGHRVEDPLFGGNNTDINNEAIQQMELITGTFNAEYGNAMSGVVNVVTKENVGPMEGRVRYKMTNLGIDEPSDNLNEKYIEGFLSGPLWPKSKVGFMVSGKWVDSDNFYQSGKLMKDETAPRGVRPSGEFSGKAFGYNDLQSFFGKVFFNPFPTAKLSLSFNYNNREWQNYTHSYKYIPDSAYVRASDSKLTALNFTHTLSKKMFYEIKLSHYQYNFLKNFGDYFYTDYSDGSAYSYNGEFNLTAGNEEYIDQKVQTLTGQIDLSYQYNRYHLLKAGFEMKRHELDYFWIFGPKRPANNQYINDFVKEPYEGALYLQDKIEFGSIVLNAGLRLDFYHPQITDYIADPNNREGSLTDATLKKQLSPRLGIAYPISEKTKFHFAYGHFFQRPNFEILYEDLNRRMDLNKPLIGNPDLEPQKTVSYELGLHTAINPNTNIQTTVFSKKIRDLVGVAWQFKGPGVPLQYGYYTNEDFAYIKGFEVNLKWRRKRINASANYSFQIAEGSSSSQEERFTGAYNSKGRQSLQFYPLGFDQRHTVNAHVALSYGKGEGPFGHAAKIFQQTYYSFLLKYGSGLPYTYNPTRKRYETNLNNARTPDTYTLDVEIEKRFLLKGMQFSLYTQIYNLLNRENVSSVYSYTGKPDDNGTPESAEYVQNPLNYYDPRTIYLGVSLGF